jgi:hypothetical protein
VKLIKYIQRKAALGDVLWIEPVVRKLAADYAKVIVVSPLSDLFRNYPLKNVIFKKDYNHFEKIVREISRIFFASAGFLNLGGAYEASPSMHILRAYLNKAGYPQEPLSYPRLYLSREEREKAPATPYVLMHVQALSSRRNFRSVHGVDWRRVKEYLEGKGFEAIGIGNDARQRLWYTRYVNPTLRELIAYVSGCAFFIGIDSGPSHIAAALRRPALVFFGSVNPRYRLLLDDFAGKVLQKPCAYAGCYHAADGGTEGRCKIVGDAGCPPCCTFTTSEVLAAVKSFVNAATCNCVGTHIK